jgi:hypothetical protein
MYLPFLLRNGACWSIGINAGMCVPSSAPMQPTKGAYLGSRNLSWMGSDARGLMNSMPWHARRAFITACTTSDIVAVLCCHCSAHPRVEPPFNAFIMMKSFSPAQRSLVSFRPLLFSRRCRSRTLHLEQADPSWPRAEIFRCLEFASVPRSRADQ